MPRKTDILFIYPPTGWEQDAMHIAENDAPPMGLLYVAAAARSAGINVAVLDLNHPVMGDTEVIDFISHVKPRIIAFSVLTPSAERTKHLSKMIKSQFQDIILLAGGIHATVVPEDLLWAGVDYIVLEEGENTLLELAHALFDNKPINDISGLAYLDGYLTKTYVSKDSMRLSHHDSTLLIKTPKRNILADLDSLPFPARDLVPVHDYGQAGAICSSRGCPYSCSFCSSVLSSGHSYRLRSITKTIEEMDTIYDSFGINRFQFLDDNFTANPDRAASFAKSLLARQYTWACQTTIMELVDRLDVLDLMFEAGCREIYFGLETGSRRLMYEYKGIKLEQAMTVLAHAASLMSKQKFIEMERLQTVVGFIIGHPEDNEETVEETIQLALELRQLGIDTMLSIMQPYPGSIIHKFPDRYGVKIENINYAEYLYPKANISTKYLTRDKIRNLYASGLLRIMKTYMT